MIKTTGAEFWRFYDDGKFWPEGAWHDYTLVKVNGEIVEYYTPETIPNDSQVIIEGGVICLDGCGDKTVDFESHFRKWRKAQNTEVIVVECPKVKAEAIKTAIKAAGGKLA
jgi:hypothetical protein